MFSRMADAQVATEDATAVPVAEPPAGRRRLRGPIQQTIDLFFVDRRDGGKDRDVPVYDGQGQTRRRPARPGSMFSAVV